MLLRWILIKKRLLHIYLVTQKYKWQHLRQRFIFFIPKLHKGAPEWKLKVWILHVLVCVCVCVFSKSHKARVNLLSLLFALLLSCSIKPRTSVKSRNVGDQEKRQRLSYFQKKGKFPPGPIKTQERVQSSVLLSSAACSQKQPP